MPTLFAVAVLFVVIAFAVGSPAKPHQIAAPVPTRTHAPSLARSGLFAERPNQAPSKQLIQAQIATGSDPDASSGRALARAAAV